MLDEKKSFVYVMLSVFLLMCYPVVVAFAGVWVYNNLSSTANFLYDALTVFGGFIVVYGVMIKLPKRWLL